MKTPPNFQPVIRYQSYLSAYSLNRNLHLALNKLQSKTLLEWLNSFCVSLYFATNGDCHFLSEKSLTLP